MRQEHIETVSKAIIELKPHHQNPNKHPERQIEKLRHLIKVYGYSKGSVVYQKSTGYILAGHGIIEALKKEGYTHVDAIEKDFSDEQALAFMISDNKIAHDSVIDNEILWNNIDLLSLLNVPSLDFAFDNDDLEKLASEKLNASGGYDAINDDYDTESEIKQISKTGDLWLLGKHRVLCGDSTEPKDVERLMDGKGIENVLTDPPYNIGFNYNKIDDKKSNKEYQEFCKKWFDNVNKAKAIILTPGPRNEKYYPEPRDKGIWVKRNATAGANIFHLRLCEPILFYGSFKGKRNTDLFEFASGFTNELREAERSSGVADKHAPAKSMKLWVELLLMFKSGNICDLFLGSGTTLIACEQLNRICYGMEIDTNYMDVIINRYINLKKSTEDIFLERDGAKIKYDEL